MTRQWSLIRPRVSRHLSLSGFPSAAPPTLKGMKVGPRHRPWVWFVVLGALVSGCSTPSALIPEDVVQTVAEEGRMHSYDVAWQNTRMLNDAILRGDDDGVAEQVVVLTARLHRLETGSASPMADRRTAGAIEDYLEQAGERSVEANRDALAHSAKALQDAFDEGDFALAKRYSLEVFALARHGGHLP